MHDHILIVDFGSQVTQLIARRVRESNVYCEIMPYTTPIEKLREFAPKGIILSGGPASVHVEDAPTISPEIFQLGVPVLGICYGQQLMCQLLGGKVSMAEEREFGRTEMTIEKPCLLFTEVFEVGMKPNVWMSHGDKVEAIPEGFEVRATSKGAPFAMIADDTRRFYGVQFHPEVVHTENGALLLKNFTHRICGCHGDWTMHAFHEEMLSTIRKQVGSGKVLCGVSGGVDSSVVAKLLHEAIGDQLVCMFVDTGLLRLNEATEVRERFEEHYKIPLVYIDASKLFMSRLRGVSDPERKRKIIGETFIEVFEREAAHHGDAGFLAQGTLYPDVIESVSAHGGPSVTIKSHHNVGGLPERMNLKLVEPLRELFKDEVRALGMELGMPHDLVFRHPFPGPGLAVRLPGEITQERADILRRADAIYIEELRNHKLYDEIWQAFAVLLPVKTVGVMGDARTYEYVCALRAVTSTDGMTADFYPMPHEILGKIANRIINEVRGVNRVVYDVTSKPPGTIEWE